ncbi:YoaK family protein [Clostridium sp. CTA-7]
MKEVITKNIIYKIRRRIPIHKKTSESLRLGILLAAVGGFLDAYTFICRGGVFANAETGNIVLVALAITKRNYKDVFMAALPILAFVAGVLVTEIIRERSINNYEESTKAEKFILIIEAVVLFIVGFIPTTIPHIFVTTTIAFVSSVQISSFRRLVDSPYSTTMCTGNLRVASQSAYLAIIKKDKSASSRSFRYIIVIFSFLFGASLGGILTTRLGVKSIWICSLILIVSNILFSIDEYRFMEKGIISH